jgi:hypothetical protein
MGEGEDGGRFDVLPRVGERRVEGPPFILEVLEGDD